MVEDIGSVIGKGFETWKGNLCICLPFVFTAILTLLVALIIIGGAIVAAIPSLPSLIPMLSKPDEFTPELFLPLMPQIIRNIGIIIAAVIITIISALLINAFFTAGAIGMAKEATETGRTDLSDMKEYGGSKFVSLLFADLIVGIITLLGLVFLIPGILYVLPNLSSGIMPSAPNNVMALAIFGLGFLGMILYMLIISIILALSRYAVVIDDLGAIEGVKTGFNRFTHHKVDVFLLWLVTLVISIAVSFILGAIPHIGQFISMLVSIIAIEPLIVIWWSRLYLSMTKPENDELII